MDGDPTSKKRPREPDPAEETDYKDKLPRYDYNSTIVVLVGPTEKRFVVHKDVVCETSKFFRAACTERWPEGREKVVRLPEVEPLVFQRYLDWTYSRKLTNHGLSLKSHKPCIKLYLLASYLDDKTLRNFSMRLLIVHQHDMKGTVPSATSAHLIWDNTASSSLLRKWLIDTLTAVADSTCLAKMVPRIPAECTQEVAVRLRQMVEHGNLAKVAIRDKVEEYLEAKNTE